MPNLCTNCGEPIEIDDREADAFHTGRNSSDTDMLCNTALPWEPTNIATL